MTTTTTTVTHPAWCSPTECDADHGGVHNGERKMLAPAGKGWDHEAPLEVYPSWSDSFEGDPGEDPCVYFYGGGEGPLTATEARRLAVMLVEAAAALEREAAR